MLKGLFLCLKIIALGGNYNEKEVIDSIECHFIIY